MAITRRISKGELRTTWLHLLSQHAPSDNFFLLERPSISPSHQTADMPADNSIQLQWSQAHCDGDPMKMIVSSYFRGSPLWGTYPATNRPPAITNLLRRLGHPAPLASPLPRTLEISPTKPNLFARPTPSKRLSHPLLEEPFQHGSHLRILVFCNPVCVYRRQDSCLATLYPSFALGGIWLFLLPALFEPLP